MLVFVAIGGLLGYRAGIQQRLDKEASQVALVATEQFQLGLQDQKDGKLDQARQRFEYVVQINPGFPGIADKLAEVMVAINLAETPTAVPTPTLTPTPDLRGVEELLAQARQQLANKDWTGTMATLDTLRKDNLDFHTVDVDGMYYEALRNLGVDNILKNGQLETGLYDLALAERFGPIDTEADGYRNWARLYLTGASFWAADWPQVINYFQQVYQALPNLRDGSGMTAVERYRTALVKYGDQLAAAGDFCKAQTQYEAALAVSPDPTVQPTAEYAAGKCAAGTQQAQPTQESATATPQVTPTSGTTPVVNTPTPPQAPTATNPPPPATPTETPPPPTAAPSDTPPPPPPPAQPTAAASTAASP